MSEKTSFWTKHGLTLKAIAIIVLALLLLIPKSMIEDLIFERQSRKQAAINEVGNTWSRSQTITGPILSIPYLSHIRKSTGEVTTVKKTAYLLPNELSVNGNVETEIRKRGIFEIPVYQSDISLSGDFDLSELDKLNIDSTDFYWDEVELNFGISDLRGIASKMSVQINQQTFDVEAGTQISHLISSGVHVAVPNLSEKSSLDFITDFTLKGSSYLMISPLGKQSSVHLTSTWADPKFYGAFLPANNEVSTDGFDASWHVSHLNRNFPQAWKVGEHNLHEADFGVELFVQASNYQQSTRAVKYAILFIALSFLVFFFSEALNGIRVHPIQYTLIGLSLILFYALLVSFSEHISFYSAYFIAAGGTILSIVLYAQSVLKSWKLAGMMSIILGLLYGFILTVISIQEFALLVGSIGLFLILGITMYVSCKIDWYGIGKKNE